MNILFIMNAPAPVSFSLEHFRYTVTTDMNSLMNPLSGIIQM